MSTPDFEEYAAARRDLLVRAAVLMGRPPGHAAGVVDAALAGAARAWRDVRDLADPDGHVWAEVLDLLATDRDWWDEPLEQPGPPEVLDRLPRDERAALVREAVLPATATVTAAAPVDRGLVEQVRAAADGVLVPVRGARPATRPPRRRMPRALVAALAAVVLVAGLGTWWALRPAPEEPEAPLGALPVLVEANPLPVAWFGTGSVHLPEASVAVDGVRSLVEVGDGAVYVDQQGRVVALAPDGGRRLLGSADPDAGLVVDAERLLVAFLAADGGARQVVVVDVPPGDVVARREVGPGTRLLALDADGVRSADEEAVTVWDQTTGEVDTTPTPQGPVVAARDGTTVQQVDAESLLITRDGLEAVVLGQGAQVSPGGEQVLTTTARGLWRVVTAGGEEVRTGLTVDDVIVDAAFVAPGVVTYFTVRAQDQRQAGDFGRISASGQVSARTCRVGARPRCERQAVVARSPSPFLLAR